MPSEEIWIPFQLVASKRVYLVLFWLFTHRNLSFHQVFVNSFISMQVRVQIFLLFGRLTTHRVQA